MTRSSGHKTRLARRLRRAAVIILINAAMTAALLAGVEFLLAASAPDLPRNGRFADGLHTWGHEVVNNRLGFRERDFAIPKPEGTFRVMVLGDSLTWGAGLAVGERYTAITEELLNALPSGASGAHPGRDVRFEVLNFGVIGGPTTLERDILRKHAEAVDPDLIVVGFCLNDPQPRAQDYSVERERFDRGGGRVVRRMAAGLSTVGLEHVGRVLHDGIYRLAEAAGVLPSWQVALERAYDPDSPEWQGFVHALADISRISAERDLPAPIFAVLNQGTFTDRPTDYAHPDEELRLYLSWYHRAEAAGRRAGFITFHHEDEIATRLAGEPLAVNVADGHPSAGLNRLYGRKLFDRIRERLDATPREPSASRHRPVRRGAASMP